jgi:hypothetical protein
VEEETIK